MSQTERHPDCPQLFKHRNRQWCRKIGGQLRYFGVDDTAALDKYKQQFPYLQIGLDPPSDCTTLADVLNAFDDNATELRDAGRIGDRTYENYMQVCGIIADTLGAGRPIDSITPLDLKRLSHKLCVGKNKQPLSPYTYGPRLTIARMVFLFANEMLGCKIQYRKALKSPKKEQLRKRRAAVGKRMFSDAEIRALLDKADPHMKAVIYLGINCGFGPMDCICLPTDKIADGFHNYARGKTGVERRCPLWPETQAAIEAIADGEHVLNGRVWNRHVIARQFKALCEDCGFYRAGITAPYSLRRTFETVAKNADVNQSVIDKIMGHERPDMSEVYNQHTPDKQLIRCTDFVRGWLLGRISLD